MPALFAPIPVLRSFSEEKAKEFYLGYLGMQLDWEHRFEPDMPLYMQVSRGELRLHISEHHGDGVPGSAVFVPVREIDDLLAELRSKNYRHLRPDIVEQDWGRELHLLDPFGNKIRLCELRA
ncbi:MAG TPA: glyoxalase superfamily protein [Telluria sp.]|nr:glyoxalase superfamily protein [Telluria sp.]